MSEYQEDFESAFNQFKAVMADLKAWELRVIEMKYEGFSSMEIKDTIKKDYNAEKTDENIRGSMSINGKLYTPYSLYAQMKNAESLAEGERDLKQATKLAAKTLTALLSKRFSGSVRLGACKDILDRNLGRGELGISLTDNRAKEDRETLKEIAETLIESNDQNKEDSKKLL